MLISWIATLSKRLVAVFFVLIVGWHLANGATPPKGRAVVNMGHWEDVVVSFDHGDHLLSSSMGIPMSCELEAGTHVAQFWHQGSLVRRAIFEVKSGQQVVIEAVPAGHVDDNQKQPAGPVPPSARDLDGENLTVRINTSAGSVVGPN